MKRVLLVVTMITLLASSSLQAAEVDLAQFIQETQKIAPDENTFRLLWWIPTEYWEESFRATPNMTEAQKNDFYAAVNDYIVFAVIDATTTTFGSVVPKSKEWIQGNLIMSIGDGKPMGPLKGDEIGSDANNLFAMMKPLMANMLGQFGEGMEFICFKGLDAKKERLLDPKARNSFTVTLGERTYKWRLPLGSLLPPKYDAETGERFSGNYLYSPFSGKELTTKAPAAAVKSKGK